MKLPPGALELAPSQANATVYITYGWRDGVSAEQRVERMGGNAMSLPWNHDPYAYQWPVNGHGVILLDHGPLAEQQAQVLGLAIKRDGGQGLIWVNHVTGNTTSIIS